MLNILSLVETEEEEFTYCIGPCTCGRNCHFNAKLHTRITGALAQDDVEEEEEPVVIAKAWDIQIKRR